MIANLVRALPFLCKIGFDCVLEKPAAMCKTSADCGAGLTCVVENQYYAQCVSCDATSFAKQCSYMSETFLPKAEDACKINHCGDRCPHHKDTECDGPKNCVIQKDNTYAQCVDCTNKTSFQAACSYWSDEIRVAAEMKCGINCTGAPPSPTPSGQCHNDTDCSKPKVCVEEADKSYAQCIDCSNKTWYAEQCVYWSPNIRMAASTRCGMTCNATSGGACHGTDLTCLKPQTCVEEDDKYYAQCVDCTNKTWFDTQCKYWSNKILDAAEKKCGIACPPAAKLVESH